MKSISALHQACWFWLTLLLLLVTCAVSKELIAGASQGELNHSEELKRLTTDFWEWRLAISPEYGTKFGLKTHVDRLSQFTEAALAEQVEKAQEYLAAAKRIDPRQLNEAQEVTSLEVLVDLLTSFINGYPYRNYGTYTGFDIFVNPLTEMKEVIIWTKFDTIQDYENVLQRYKAFIQYLQQKQAFLDLALKNGTTVAIPILEVIIKELESFPSDPEETFFYKPFKNLNSTSLKNKAREMITNEITPAVRTYTEYVTNEYKPRARKELGVGSLPGGKEFYRACLRWHLSLDLTPEQIFEKGKEEVKRISANIKRLMDKENFQGNLRAYITHMKNKRENMFNNQEEMLQNFKDTVELVHGKLNTILSKIPKSALAVRSSPSPNFPTGKYTEPTLDGARGGIFVANTWDPETRPRFSVMALTLHEAEPGHHTQMAYAIEEDIPNFRRAIEYRKYYSIPFNWPFYTAYVEGWALYAESLGEEMGLFSDPNSLLGRYTSEIFRACRLVVDTGIHHYGWSAQEAKDYLLEYTDLPGSQIDVEIKRYASYPGQATSYKIGELTILELREKAEKKLGDKFDLRHFHTIILQLGPVPLSTVEKAVYNWINREAAAVRSGTTLYHVTPSLLLTMGLLSILVFLKKQ